MVADEPLTDDERRVWEYIQKYDFEGNPWSTPEAAKALKMSEDDVYAAIAEVNKKVGDDLYIYYRRGALRLATEREPPKGAAPKEKATKGKKP
jgi:hypothetical protein